MDEKGGTGRFCFIQRVFFLSIDGKWMVANSKVPCSRKCSREGSQTNKKHQKIIN